MKNPQLLCHNCRENKSMYLLYYEKLYRDTRKISITDPMLICEDCKGKYLTYNVLFENKPVFIPFSAFKTANWQKVMWLCSMKGKERNDLECPIWRKRLQQIKKIMDSMAIKEKIEKAIVYWQPMGI